MKKFIFFVFSLFWLNHTYAQNESLEKLERITDSIESEGKMLYRSEFASWYGTDVFTGKCKYLLAQAGGYLSYDTKEGMNNIFFSKDTIPLVLATISFGSDFNPNNYKLDTVRRKLTEKENDLYTIRKLALEEMNRDTMFKHYRNTNLNLVPIIARNFKRVYVLTGPQVNGVIVFGNDYLIDFDKDDNITDKRKLHKGIIPIEFHAPTADTSKNEVSSIHSHLPEYSPFMTATDICTLMLYEKFTTWTQHIVVSKNYVSIWDCKKNELVIITMDAWKRIYEQEKKN
ncbi:MAG TPA: hypothetical protein VHC47_11120 [Mucilaginibacter sp.]|nr:hypothetical protein [Mucilaginibacter sp.]